MTGARVNRFVRFVCMIVINYNMWIWLLYVLCVGSSTLREGRFFPTGTPFVWLDISEPPLIRESDDTYLRRQEIRGPFGSRLWFTFPPVQKVW